MIESKLMKIKYEEIKLSNGVRVVGVPLLGLNSVTIEVFVKIGAKYEPKKWFGISHFLEHMAFKGTRKRPEASEIHKEMDAKGVSHNAGTGLEFTSYYIKTIQENVGWAAELLSDMILNSTFPQEEVAKEAGVIKEEIKMYEDNPTMGLSSDFMEMMFKDTGIGCWSIAGTVAGVGKITREDLVEYRKFYLNPKEMVVVLAGNVTSELMVSLKEELERWFGGWRGTKGGEVKVEMLAGDKLKQEKAKQIEQGHFCVGVPGISWKDKRKHTARLVDIMMCGNSSSRIVNEIREKQGLAYYVFPISESLEEGGIVGVQEGVRMDRLDFAIDRTIEMYSQMVNEVKLEELERAKDYLIGKTKLSMDKTDFWSGFVGQKLLLEGETIGLEEEIEKYRAVTLDEVKEYAASMFVKNNFRVLSVRQK
jgi:predicted Zn-dependent peptidase